MEDYLQVAALGLKSLYEPLKATFLQLMSKGPGVMVVATTTAGITSFKTTTELGVGKSQSFKGSLTWLKTELVMVVLYACQVLLAPSVIWFLILRLQQLYSKLCGCNPRYTVCRETQERIRIR